MGYELRGHTADVAVEATGSDLAETFENLAAGLTETHSEAVPDDVGDRISVTVSAESRESLLFDYLDELVYQRDAQGVLPTDHEVTIIGDGDQGEWSLEASARGVPFDAVDAREIKAVTYSEMELEETADGWRAYVVFDV